MPIKIYSSILGRGYLDKRDERKFHFIIFDIELGEGVQNLHSKATPLHLILWLEVEFLGITSKQVLQQKDW